jgi:hypothetical protein
VQADTHKASATNTARVRSFHHVDEVFQSCVIPVSS